MIKIPVRPGTTVWKRKYTGEWYKMPETFGQFFKISIGVNIDVTGQDSACFFIGQYFPNKDL